MKRNLLVLTCLVGSLSTGGAHAMYQGKDPSSEAIDAFRREVVTLRKQMEAERRAYEERLDAMQKKIDAVSQNQREGLGIGEEDALEAAIAKSRTETSSVSDEGFGAKTKDGVQSMNPEISVIMDTFYHNSDAGHGVDEALAEMSGLGHGHGHEHDHGHAALEEGFGLRHLELYFSGDVDPYFKGYAIGAISEDGAEMEEAVIQTTCLPAGFQLQAGKFFSHFGRVNSQHTHQWDFVDQPLVYHLTLGEHGLNEKGLQLSWSAPTPFHLLTGVEAFQGENELLFSYIGGDELPDESGARLWVGWLKLSPNLPPKHGLQAGLFGGRGIHQEEHDGDADGEHDHWLDGHGLFAGADLVYKYDSKQAYGLGDFILQGEYFWRKKDLSVYRHDLNSLFEGRDRIDEQDGYYLQALYGFLPRWRAGLRWEQVGLTNESAFPDGATEIYDASHRIAGMLDFTPTEFSRIRLQANRGEYELEDGTEDFWQVYLQLMVSLGTHGAHNF